MMMHAMLQPADEDGNHDDHTDNVHETITT